jgi:hypothetical protein
MFVVSSVAFTVAPAIIPPVGSVTKPLIVPLKVCAGADNANNNKANNTTANRFFTDSPPDI